MRIAKYEELETISLLMNELFHTQMQESYSKEGQDAFLEQLRLSALQERFTKNSVFYVDEKIETVLELENESHIAFLFSKHPNQGNAHKLCNFAFSDLQDKIITVGAFSGAIGFYEKEGFIKIQDEQNVHGLSFTLMAKNYYNLTHS
jgi:hypothetical protein